MLQYAKKSEPILRPPSFLSFSYWTIMPSSAWLRTAIQTLFLTSTLMNNHTTPIRSAVPSSGADSHPNLERDNLTVRSSYTDPRISPTSPTPRYEEARMPESDVEFTEADLTFENLDWPVMESILTPQTTATFGFDEVLAAIRELSRTCVTVAHSIRFGELKSAQIDAGPSTYSIARSSRDLIREANALGETLSSTEERDELASSISALAQVTACVSMAMYAADPDLDSLSQTCSIFLIQIDSCLDLGMVSRAMARNIKRKCRH